MVEGKNISSHFPCCGEEYSAILVACRCQFRSSSWQRNSLFFRDIVVQALDVEGEMKVTGMNPTRGSN
jgi:hypothetical protein